MAEQHAELPPTLVEAALLVLNTADPWEKARLTYSIVDAWRSGKLLPRPDESAMLTVPERPARADDKVKLVGPGNMPRLGKGGTPASRQAILHSLVHIENWAVDLSWDIIARYGNQSEYAQYLPREFFDDFVQVAEDECRHFTLLNQRLEALGSHYGALPAHDGLWESAQKTAGSLPARLAVEHCVHEARGLDVLPSTVAKFRNNGDPASADLLEGTVYAEEISHCAAGVRWLQHLFDAAQRARQVMEPSQSGAACSTVEEAQLCGRLSHCHTFATAADSTPHQQDGGPQQHGRQECSSSGAADAAAGDLGRERAAGAAGTTTAGRPPEQQLHSADQHSGGGCDGEAPAWMREAWEHGCVQEWFHALIRQHFKGALKPPFNVEARSKAGFTPEWYLPLATAS